MNNPLNMSRMRLSLIIPLLLASTASWAATRVPVELPAFKRASLSSSPQVHQLSAAMALGAATELKVEREAPTKHGTRRLRMQQYWHGVPVFGAVATIEAGDKDTMLAAQGGFYRDVSADLVDATPRLSKDDVRQLWRQANGVDRDQVENRDVTLYVFPQANAPARLVYLVSHFSPGTRPTAFIDANSGEILKRWEGLTHAEETIESMGPGGNAKTGRYTYGVDRPALQVSQRGTSCTTITPEVSTFHAHNTGSINFSRRPTISDWIFPCGMSQGDEVNGGFGPINDAHHFGGVVFNMYRGLLDTRPLKDSLRLVVHVGRGEGNASWNGRDMWFGDGDSVYYPVVSLDVIAHEVSHGFTEQNSGLVYHGQSGGMNEAFSDMAGEMAKWFDTGSNDFMAGGSVFKEPSAALRYLCEPTRDGQSIDHTSRYHSSLDVHYSSGIYNKAFCLLSQSQGWDVKNAFLAFARANQLYWAPDETFDRGACGVQSAAKDLDLNEAGVIAAFDAVGVTCRR
ncbi:M4 family metallopeptidase [Dyella sp.]|uniref:M4 family metallopeptidase n=1 Tax=Dyella sp. TaxID=1869338 RepID=UPI002ED612BC